MTVNIIRRWHVGEKEETKINAIGLCRFHFLVRYPIHVPVSRMLRSKVLFQLSTRSTNLCFRILVLGDTNFNDRTHVVVVVVVVVDHSPNIQSPAVVFIVASKRDQTDRWINP